MRCADFKASYIADEAIFQSLFVKCGMAALFAALIIFPFLSGPYELYIANLIGFAVIGAVGLNILTGFTGQISLGHAAFIGIGGYTAAILITRLNFPFWLALPCAGLVSAAAGVVIGIPSLRVKGLYLCVATLAAQFIFEFLFINVESLTKGIRGINLPAPKLFLVALDSERKFYFLTVALAVLLVAYARNLFRSRVGRAFVAIRDRDLAAEIMGISLFRYKLMAFGISSFYAGICGALWVNFMRIVTPEHFPFHLSIQYLAMIIVGGLGSVQGSIFGAVFMTLVPELLNVLSSTLSQMMPGLQKLFIPMKEVVFGTLIVMFLVFEPHGLAAIWRRIKAFFWLWPFSY
jgi:branched-chain amino acid transport system permease protein